MLFHYTSFQLAKAARKTGIAATKHFNGVPFTMRRPFTNTYDDYQVFRHFGHPAHDPKFPNESVLVLSLPARFLEKLPGYENDPCLCRVSAEILSAMRPTSFMKVVDEQPWLRGVTLLPPNSILRSYYIMRESEENYRRHSSVLVSSSSKSDEIVHVFANDGALTDAPLNVVKHIDRLNSISTFCDKMALIRKVCEHHNLIPLYHYTDPKFAPLILRSGLRMSTQGQGDGGVYVSTQGPASYGLGSADYEVNIIKDCFGVERINEYKGKGKLDVVLIYGCCGSLLDQVCALFINLQLILLLFWI
jgi:hypothetical protein